MAGKQVIQVQISSELKGSFAGLAKQLTAVQNSLKSVETLASSVKKLTDSLGSNTSVAKAVTNMKKAADAAKSVNKYTEDGAKIAARNASEQTKLINQIAKVNAAKKAGAVSEKARLEAEISLLDKYIKKTGDIAILSQRGLRSDRGQFFSVSSGARSGVTLPRVKPMSPYVGRGISSSNGIGIQSYINSNLTRDSGMLGMLRSDDASFNRLKLRYQELQNKASFTSKIVRALKFSPNPDNGKGAFSKLLAEYSHMGRAIFNLQLATSTFLAVSGVGEVLKLADSYTTLRNQIALTSESTADIGKNMKDVFDISKGYFLDPKSVATTYSQINGLRQAMGLTKVEVKGVSAAISGAFAASSGEASSRAQAQYQLGQALSSNKLGGDELRSIAENADFVKYILNKYGATARGGKVGDPIQLYGSKTPLGTKEIASIFNRKDVQDEITKANANKARTFGDAANVAKVRLMELYNTFNSATGIFGRAANGIARWLADDTAFKKFTDALTLASIGLTVFAAKAAGDAAIAGGKSLLTRVAPELMGGYGPDLSGTARRRQGILNFGRKSVNGLRAAGSFAANSPQLAGDALNAVASGAAKVPGLLANTAKGFASMVGSLKNASTWTGGFTKLMSGLGGGLKMVSSGLVTVIAEFLGLGGILEALGLPVIAIVAVIALLIYRFNSLLGSMNGGMNIIDVMVGLWEKLKRGFVALIGYLEKSPFAPIIKGFELLFSTIDKWLGWLVKKAGQDADIRQAQANRQYDSNNDGVFSGTDKGGNQAYQLTLTKNGTYDWAKDKKGNRIAVKGKGDVVYGENATNVSTLPTGFQNGIPELPQTKTPTDRKANRWAEFLRDMKLQVQEVANYSGLTDFGKEMKSNIDEIRKKALDALDFDTSKYATLDEAFAAYGKTKNNHVAEINKWTDALNTTKMAEARKNLVSGLNNSLLTAKTNLRKIGMSQRSADELDRSIELIQKFADLVKDQAVRDSIDKALSTGNISGADSTLRNYFNQNGAKDENGISIDARNYRTARKQGNLTAKDTDLRNMQESIRQQKIQLNNAMILSGIYGQNKDTAQSMLDIIDDQYAKYGELIFTNEDYKKKLQEQLDLVKQQADFVKAVAADWKNGAKEALQEYIDNIGDFASLIKDGIGSALNTAEDQLVSLVQTGKANFSQMFSDLQAMMIKFTLRRFVIKPILDWAQKSPLFKGLFGDKLQDKVITAKNVYLTGNIVGGSGDAGSANGLMSLFNGGSSGSAPASGSSGGIFSTIAKWGSTIASFFHTGGVVGGMASSMSMAGSVFNHARKYHTGTNSVGSRSLMANEVPAILKMGETVLTRNQTGVIGRALQAGNTSQQNTFSPTISLNYTSSGDSQTSQTDAKAMLAMLRAEMQQQMNDFAIRSSRPGSALYNNGRR